MQCPECAALARAAARKCMGLDVAVFASQAAGPVVGRLQKEILDACRLPDGQAVLAQRNEIRRPENGRALQGCAVDLAAVPTAQVFDVEAALADLEPGVLSRDGCPGENDVVLFGRPRRSRLLAGETSLRDSRGPRSLSATWDGGAYTNHCASARRFWRHTAAADGNSLLRAAHRCAHHGQPGCRARADSGDAFRWRRVSSKPR